MSTTIIYRCVKCGFLINYGFKLCNILSRVYACKSWLSYCPTFIVLFHCSPFFLFFPSHPLSLSPSLSLLLLLFFSLTFCFSICLHHSLPCHSVRSSSLCSSLSTLFLKFVQNPFCSVFHLVHTSSGATSHCAFHVLSLLHVGFCCVFFLVWFCLPEPHCNNWARFCFCCCYCFFLGGVVCGSVCSSPILISLQGFVVVAGVFVVCGFVCPEPHFQSTCVVVSFLFFSRHTFPLDQQ